MKNSKNLLKETENMTIKMFSQVQDFAEEIRIKVGGHIGSLGNFDAAREIIEEVKR